MKLPAKGRVATLLSAVIVLLGLVALPTYAQQKSGNGFRISPVRSEFVIEKGKSQTLVVTLENPSDAVTVAQPIINDFIASDKEDGEPRLLLDEDSERPKNSFRSLVQKGDNVTLGPREKKDIPVRIVVPEDANAGGYYGAIRFIPMTDGLGAGNVGLTASVGTIVLVRVPGDLTERLDLVQLTATQSGKPKSFLTKGDVSVLVRLKNSGDIHVKPFGKVQVKNMFGSTVSEYEINAGDTADARANILPDSIRKFEDKVTKPNRGWLGRYTIVANIGYSQGTGQLITAETTFWYMPLWSIIVLLLLLVLLIGGAYWLYKRLAVPKQKHGASRK